MDDPRQNQRFKTSTKRNVREAMEPHQAEATMASLWWLPLPACGGGHDRGGPFLTPVASVSCDPLFFYAVFRFELLFCG